MNDVAASASLAINALILLLYTGMAFGSARLAIPFLMASISILRSKESTLIARAGVSAFIGGFFVLLIAPIELIFGLEVFKSKYDPLVVISWFWVATGLAFLIYFCFVTLRLPKWRVPGLAEMILGPVGIFIVLVVSLHLQLKIHDVQQGFPYALLAAGFLSASLGLCYLKGSDEARLRW